MYYNKSKLSKLKDLRADTFKNFLDAIGRDTLTHTQLLAWSKKLAIPKLQVFMKYEELNYCNMDEPINIIINIEA